MSQVRRGPFSGPGPRKQTRRKASGAVLRREAPHDLSAVDLARGITQQAKHASSGWKAPQVLFGVTALVVTAGCAKPDVEIRALPNGTRQLTCRHTLPQCLSHVDDVCKGASYEILYATDTQKVYGSPSSNEVESRTSQAVVHCLGQHQEPMGEAVAGQSLIAAAAVASASAPAKPGTAPAASGAAAPAAAPRAESRGAAPIATAAPAARSCVPGSTQACVGPAACSGGQSCLPDGSGFGACDCGAAKASP